MDNSNIEERLLVQDQEQEHGNHSIYSHEDLRRKIWTEAKLIWRVAIPAAIARLTSFGTIVVTQLFMGHISSLALASFALEQSLVLRFVYGILIGMSSATDTLCGQAYGAGQYQMMGIYLQRSWIVDGVTATIFLPLFIFTKQYLELIGQHQDIAVEAGKISYWFIPMLYRFVFSFTMQMFLQAQMKNNIIGWLSAVSFVVHVTLSWLLVYKGDLGIAGPMIALNVSNWLVVIGEFVYIFGGWCSSTWQGFSVAAFADILPVVKLSISSGIMICLELWYNSILVLLAGYMTDATVEISALSICLNISAWEFMVFLALGVAASVRVSNELGRGNAKGAQFSIKVILAISTCLGLIFFILCLIYVKQIAYLFTSSEEVVETVSDLSLLLSLTVLLNSIQPVLSGIAVGTGLQGTVAIVNLGSYYVIGIPIGAVLAYVAGLQVKGLWIGMVTGVVLQTLLLTYLIWSTDWDKQVNKAAQRLNRWVVKPLNEPNESNNTNLRSC